MKPCECKSIADYDCLNEQAIAFNQYKLSVVDGTAVLLEINPYVRLRIPSAHFKRFAEWYLADQDEQCQ